MFLAKNKVNKKTCQDPCPFITVTPNKKNADQYVFYILKVSEIVEYSQ